jgi:hypothetical protein
MKFTKMSLVAALLMGSSAFAIDNIKMSGDAKLFYATSDAKSGYDQAYNAFTNGYTKKDGDLFSKDSSAADAALSLNITADLYKNDMVSISAGAGYTVLSTLGLENNLVSNVWGGSHQATFGTGASYGTVNGGALNGAKVENANWMTEAWLAVTAGKTTVKLGRMELDTPLAFTETWSAEKNTFEAIVAVNQDIPDTTLVGAYVGNGNGSETFGQANMASNINPIAGVSLAYAPVVNGGGKFATYGRDGAYAIGAINNSFKPLTAQAWYYNVMDVATAYWLQADLNMEGIVAGAQYTGLKADAVGAKEDNVYALMLGYEMKDVATFKIAYSDVNKNGSVGAAGFNTATSTGASKLYTEAWWNYGYVTRSDTQTISVSAEANVATIDLGAYYTDANQGSKKDIAGNELRNVDMKEFTLTAGKDFGPLNATLAYIYTKADDQNIKPYATKGSSYNSVQAYLTLNF